MPSIPSFENQTPEQRKAYFVSKDKNYGNTPMHEASAKGNVNELRQMIQWNAPINVKNNYGHTPIFMAADQNHPELVRLLAAIDGCNINDADLKGRTPLLNA